MYFKTLEIQGFKSFADKTVLNFDTKMTAIVGSNGNGKSNISDALRWVMGEQGAKTLRGDKMEDVIFHGTVSRRQMGFAKVALSIDNADRALPIETDEVVITRKLYRTGESEYLINGEKSRLKDIQELLLGTGLGRDGYSIIGQGRVAEIVNAKGSQRREIFEEAAGVSKFLHRKAEAERELSRAEENLLRLKDIELSLEERLPALEKQSEKARRAKLLLEEEKTIEISVTAAELERLRKSLTETENAILVNQGECEHFDREIGELEEENERLTITKGQFSARLDELRRMGDRAKDEMADADKEIAVLENEIRHNDARIEEITRRIEEGKRSAAEFDERIARLDGEADAAKRSAEDCGAEMERLRDRITASIEENKGLSEEHKALDEKTGILYGKLTEAKLTAQQAEQTVQSLTEQFSADTERVENQEKLADEYREKRRALAAELDRLGEESADLENRLNGYEKLFGGKRDRLAAKRAEFEELRKSYERKRQRLEVLSDVEKNMVGYFSSVKSVIQAAKAGRLSGIRGTVADILSVDKKYGIAIETALGNALQNIIVENEETAKRCIRYLKDTNGGRATFYPLTSVKGTELNQSGLSDEEGFEGLGSELVRCDPEYLGIVRSVLGKTAVADDINTATRIAKKYGYRFRIITLDGQVINAGGSFTGGSVKETSGIISRKQEIDTLFAETTKLKDTIGLSRGSLTELEAEVRKTEMEIEGYKDRLRELKEDEIRLTAEIGGVKDLILQCEEQRENAELVIDRGRKQLAQQREVIEECIKRRAQIEAQIKENEEKLALSGERLEKADSERSCISDRIGELNLKRLSFEKDAERIAAERASVEAAKSAAGESEEKSRAEIVAIGENSEAIRKEIADKRERVEGYRRSLGDNDAAIGELIRKENECEQRMAAVVREIREKSEDKTKFSSALAVAVEKRSAIERDDEKLRATLWEKYELTVSEAREQAQKLDDLPEAQKQLRELRQKISALGNVNFAAIEEFEEVKAKYDELSGQLGDVERSKRELEKLIAAFTADIKARFLASFNDINEKFSEIFKEVFGGGEAHLALIDPEDVLGSGIEIFAAPPGKLIKNLISLSGGEQTMVAITIYFAILLHRPTPFCMLDEVDAALDEINVVKYITYLKRFCTRTQLMVITHRRGTIEGCDVLYGVYMQEKGVSKLLHQELIDDLELELD
ncbi:MAG: chromosome segregation protein SMC [Bacteroides sp.]|nr:chromosome segregation protein SMC [Eubacterium sp.]MCM1418574.1 chromosome segregation protein SMC [Roseburia sp.]MCM1462629.1 chromosome segregation protein SMC [Bacteroides sp.]